MNKKFSFAFQEYLHAWHSVSISLICKPGDPCIFPANPSDLSSVYIFHNFLASWLEQYSISTKSLTCASRKVSSRVLMVWLYAPCQYMPSWSMHMQAMLYQWPSLSLICTMDLVSSPMDLSVTPGNHENPHPCEKLNLTCACTTNFLHQSWTMVITTIRIKSVGIPEWCHFLIPSSYLYTKFLLQNVPCFD